MTETDARGISVVGDVTVDWAIVTPPGLDSKLQLAYLWEHPGSVTVSAMPGSAALLESLTREVGARVVSGPRLPDQAMADPQFPGVAKTFTAWNTFPLTSGSAEGRWRLREFLGWVSGTDEAAFEDPARGAILVIDDANLGFRDNPGRWRSLLAHPLEVVAIVLKMATPIGTGALWDELVEGFGDRLTVYLTLGDLRKEDAAVGEALSWERTASEVVAAVRRRPDLQAAARVVVGIGLSGAVVVERGGEATLVYDPENLEGDWEALHPGVTYGAGSAITAAIASALQRQPEPDFRDAVAAGLGLGRSLHREGLRLTPGSSARISVPSDSTKTEVTSSFSTGKVSEGSHWSFLREHGMGQFREIAERVLLEGIQPAASGIPVERMGAWASVDRGEIESIRSVRNIVREYLSHEKKPRPLSIAVFGPPGSGKSFAIKQMAGQWALSGVRLEALEFNVSQFSNQDALGIAFQRVRDCAVEGSLPLVFWDEFDSARNGSELGWLAQFLAPMQDGVFLEGPLTRPIGSAIFVFAGGTHSTMESFKARASALPGAKATDFLSRLRGYVDVLGPNRFGPEDESFVVRRAFLLRQILQRRAPQLTGAQRINIDPGVANAFLSVERYVHGARSMESIVDMSALTGRSRFARSSLPAAHQLSLHVDAAEFLELLM